MENSAGTSLQENSVGTGHIVFFVIAAAAPLTAIVGATPAAFAFGNGPGVPGTFLIAGIIYLLFGAAFTAMTRSFGSAGGFYSYIGHGLGWPIGAAGAFVAIASYTAIQSAIYGLFSYFLADELAAIGLSLPWWIIALGCIAIVHVCGARDVAFSGRLLGLLMLGEVLILLALDIAIFLRPGNWALSFASFLPSTVVGPGMGVALVFVVASYIGFEATTIFSEEARDPTRTIPRATYLAVLFITLFYAFSTWAMVQLLGGDAIAARAGANPGDLYFAASRMLLGRVPTVMMQALVLTSLFASQLAFHNTITRYLFALSRDGLLFAGIARTHPRFRSPYIASMVQTISATLIILIFAFMAVDPYAILFSWMSAFATVGILAVQCLVSLAVLRVFATHDHDMGIGRTVLAPALSGIGLAICLWLVVANLPLLAGTQSAAIQLFPVVSLMIGLAGALLALRLKYQRPDRYALLAQSLEQVG